MQSWAVVRGRAPPPAHAPTATAAARGAIVNARACCSLMPSTGPSSRCSLRPRALAPFPALQSRTRPPVFARSGGGQGRRGPAAGGAAACGASGVGGGAWHAGGGAERVASGVGGGARRVGGGAECRVSHIQTLGKCCLMWFLVCDRSAARAEAEAEREGAARRHAARVRELEVQVCSGGARSLSGGRLGRYRTRRCWEIEK